VHSAVRPLTLDQQRRGAATGNDKAGEPVTTTASRPPRSGSNRCFHGMAPHPLPRVLGRPDPGAIEPVRVRSERVLNELRVRSFRGGRR
jgi:hypothetical protein